MPGRHSCEASGSCAALKAIEKGGSRFAQGEAIAFGGGEQRVRGQGNHLEPLAREGAAGAGKLPGIGDQKHRRSGMLLVQPGGREGGVLPGGAGAGITSDTLRREALSHQQIARSGDVTRDVGRNGLALAVKGGSQASGGDRDGRPATHDHGNDRASGSPGDGGRWAGGDGRRTGHLRQQPGSEGRGAGGAVDRAQGQGDEQAHRQGGFPWPPQPPGQHDHHGDHEGHQQVRRV